jgi:hypothetical protein
LCSLNLMGRSRGAQQNQDIVGFALHSPILLRRSQSGGGLPVDVEQKARLLAAMHRIAPLLFDLEGG